MVSRIDGRPYRRRNPLLTHDFAILHAILIPLFQRVLDGVTLVGFVIALVALARHGLSNLTPQYAIIAVALSSGFAAIAVHAALMRRIAYFRTDSVLVSHALRTKTAAVYVLVFHTIVSLSVALSLFSGKLSEVLQSIMSWWSSVLICVVVATLLRHFIRAASPLAIDRFNRFVATRYSEKAVIAAAMVGCLGAGLASVTIDGDGAVVLAAVSALIIGLWFSPVSYSVVNFERLVGRSVQRTAWVQLKYLTCIAAAFGATGVIVWNWRLAGAAIAVMGILFVYKLLEVLLARALPASRVQFALTMCLFALMTIGAVMPLLLAAALPVLCIWLGKLGRARTYQLL